MGVTAIIAYMKKLKLINLSNMGTQPYLDYFPSFTIDNYEFHSQAINSSRQTAVHGPAFFAGANRRNRQNAYVQFSHHQSDSVIFSGGRIGTMFRPTHERKFIEDILLLGSMLSGHNWAFYSRKHTTGYPVTPTHILRQVSKDFTEIESDITSLISKLQDSAWQQQFNNGFHIIMLLNTANIHNAEARFLSMMVIWEFLYCKLFGAESFNLNEILTEVLKYYWPNDVNGSIFQHGKIGGKYRNVFYVLRNQFAHSGKLPIDRRDAEQWMAQLPWEDLLQNGGGVKKYLSFFEELTQVVVMKTMDFHPETRDFFNLFDFSTNLNKFLSTGSLR